MNAPHGHALLVCDATARDPNGKITLYGIFDRILSSRFPVVHPMFAIYWRCAVPGPGRVAVELVKPDGSALAELEPVETTKEAAHVLQGTYALGAFEFPSEGEYLLVLRYNGNEVLRNSLHLKRRD